MQIMLFVAVLFIQRSPGARERERERGREGGREGGGGRGRGRGGGGREGGRGEGREGGGKGGRERERDNFIEINRRHDDTCTNKNYNEGLCGLIQGGLR